MMSKKKAHMVLILLDVFSIGCLWAGYRLISQVVIDIANSANAIEINNRVGFFCFGLLMPMVHLFAIFEYFYPKTVEKRMALFNWSAFILLIVLFASSFFMSARMQTYVERAGYLRCPQADRQLSFSSGLVYTKDDAACRRLVEEKRKPQK